MTRIIRNKQYRSDYLFVTPSFLMGIGSIFNIGGNYFPFNYSESGREADLKAIESDWGVIGQDIIRQSRELELSVK